MSVQKPKRFQSRKLLDAAKGQACVICGRQDDTVVPAHLPGSYYGMASGTSQKTHDWLVAHVCGPTPEGKAGCHDRLDSVWRTDTEIRMRALCRTLEWLFEQGILTVK